MPSFLQNFGRTVSNLGTRLNLPELGISERFGYTPPKPQVLAKTDTQTGSTYGMGGPNIMRSPVSKPYAITTPAQGGGSAAAPQIAQPNYGQIDQQVDDYTRIIEEEYNNAIRGLESQESGIRGEADSAKSQIETDYEDTINSLMEEQALKESGIRETQSVAERESKSAIQQTRDWMRETERANQAQLSSLGISSSSASEALAERLGVETARRISGVTGTLTEIRINSEKELGRVRDHYKRSMTTLEKVKANKLADLNGDLMSALSSINNARSETATSKAKNRLDLIYQAQEQKNNLLAQFEAAKQRLAEWSLKKTEALVPLSAGDFNEVFGSQLQKIQSALPEGQFALPSFSVDKYGQMTGDVRVERKKDDENKSGLNLKDISTYQ